MTTPPEQELAIVADHLAKARSILFITGAGISADSGLPTYRGIGGLYESAQTEDDLPIETLLSGPMLRQRPDLVWKYLLQMESACRGRHCNAAHRFIAGVESWREDVWTLTQNVDGFHRQAGSRQLIEMHGDIHQLLCLRCGERQQVDSYAGLDLPPRCHCGGTRRPEVVLFGEMLPSEQVDRYDRALSSQPDLVFSIGTTSVFPYIAAPVADTARRGGCVVEINPGESEVSALAQFRWRCGAATACQALARTVRLRGGPELLPDNPPAD